MKTPVPSRLPQRAPARGRAKPQTHITALVTTHAQGDHVRAVLSADPLPQGASQMDRRAREARLVAAAYRLAAELTEANAEVLAQVAIDIKPHDAIVTIEIAEGQRLDIVQQLMGSALGKLKIAAGWR